MQLREPVLWRGPDELQIGPDPARATILRGLAPGEMSAVLDLAAPRSEAWVTAARAEGRITADVWEVVRTHLGHKPVPPAPRRGNPLVLLLDRHVLTTRVGNALVRADVAQVVAHDRGHVATAAGARGRAPDLAVLTDPWVSDPVRVRPLLRHDVAHLPMVVDDGVTVGPVVVPGVTPCTGCLDHLRTDEDAAWPAIATQLRVLPGRAVPGAEGELAAAFAARVIEDFLAGGEPPGWRLDGTVVLPVPLSRHPRCTCGGLTPPSGDGPVRA